MPLREQFAHLKPLHCQPLQCQQKIFYGIVGLFDPASDVNTQLTARIVNQPKALRMGTAVWQI